MKKINVAIIGLGSIAQGYDHTPTHFSVLNKDKRFLLVAASDPRLEARKSFKKKSGGRIKLYSDYISMIKKEKPELAVVATPTDTHYKICKTLISLGVKAILCEKPIAYSSREARNLLKLAKRGKVIFAVNYQRAFDKRYNQLKKSIQKKKWGEILAAEVIYSKGIFNTGTHVINLLETINGHILAVQPLESKTVQEIDPTLSFLADFGTWFAIFRVDKKTKASKFKLKLYFTKGVVEAVDDAKRSMFDVYDNLYSHITKGKKLLSSPEEALHALHVAEAGVRSVKLNRVITLSK